MKKTLITIFIIILIIISILFFFDRDKITFFLTKNTNLENENIDNIKITDNINSSFFIENFSNYINPEYHNMFYFRNPNIKSYRLTFNEENAPQITVGFIEQTKEIVYISKYSEFGKNSSRKKIGNKDIYIGDNLKKVIEVYGENYYNYGHNDSGAKGIGYVDKRNKLNAIFLYDGQNNIYFYSIEKYKT
ncbi:hypothetical protein [Tissierella praeacuta]|uniref:hypothetical protein n=1 Tax=Tissierella praeacuta TaxID=43131 RepID=UPI003342BC7E